MWEIMFCGKCGAQNPDTNEYCNHCGNNLSSSRMRDDPHNPQKAVTPSPIENPVVDSLVEKVRGFVLKPIESFQKYKDESLTTVFTYYFILLAIYAILLGFVLLYSPYFQFFGYNNATLQILVLVGSQILSLIVGCLWLHVWVYLLGGRNGVAKTLKSIAYAMTPALLIGWIMPIGTIIGAIWGIVLEIIGIRELQQISTAKTIIALALSFIVPLIILVLIFTIGITPINQAIVVGSYNTGNSYSSSLTIKGDGTYNGGILEGGTWTVEGNVLKLNPSISKYSSYGENGCTNRYFGCYGTQPSNKIKTLKIWFNELTDEQGIKYQKAS